MKGFLILVACLLQKKVPIIYLFHGWFFQGGQFSCVYLVMLYCLYYGTSREMKELFQARRLSWTFFFNLLVTKFLSGYEQIPGEAPPGKLCCSGCLQSVVSGQCAGRFHVGWQKRQTLVPFVRYHKCTLSSLNPFVAGEGEGKEQRCTENTGGILIGLNWWCLQKTASAACIMMIWKAPWSS